MKYTSGTGLNLDKQMALEPDAPTTDVATGPQGATSPTQPGYKKGQERKPKRIPPCTVPTACLDSLTDRDSELIPSRQAAEEAKGEKKSLCQNMSWAAPGKDLNWRRSILRVHAPAVTADAW